MLGPVFYLEMMRGGRSGRQHVFRWIYGAWLLLQLLFFYAGYWIELQPARRGAISRIDPNATARFADGFLALFVGQQYLLILLTTPVFAAGAVTDEKQRGTLQYLLTTDLSVWQILWGKLLGRSCQVGILMLTGLPVLCFIGVFGGLTPFLLLALLVSSLAPLLALAAASLLSSVWARTTRDAVLGLYVVGGLCFGGWVLLDALAGRLPSYPTLKLAAGLSQNFNPLHVLEPARGGGADLDAVARRCLYTLIAWGSVGGTCLGLAAFRLRGAYIRQLEHDGKRSRLARLLPARQPVGGDPIVWKERHVDGIAPLAPLRKLSRWLCLALVFGVTICASLAVLYESLKPGYTLARIGRELQQGNAFVFWDSISQGDASGGFLLLGILVMLLGSFVVGMRCSGSVSGEREKQTWEALLLTPIETRRLIRGKLWGVAGAVLPYMVVYAVPALGLSLLGGLAPLFLTAVCLGVTLLAMFFLGSAGVWCSVKAKSSWRSLLFTMGWGYLGGFLIFTIASPIILIVAFILYFLLIQFDRSLGTNVVGSMGSFSQFFSVFFLTTCLVMAGLVFGMAWWFMTDAEKQVAARERVRAWKQDPNLKLRRVRRAAPPKVPQQR